MRDLDGGPGRPPGSALAESVRSALAGYAPGSADQRRLRAQYLAHVEAFPAAVFKQGPPRHLTASTLVVNTSRDRVLLCLHAKARQWFQFGGHLEPGDMSLLGAATREAREESGLRDVTAAPGIVQLDRHNLGDGFGRCVEHLDVRFLAVVPDDAVPTASSESLAVQWWPVGELPPNSGGVLALVRAALEVLGDA